MVVLSLPFSAFANSLWLKGLSVLCVSCWVPDWLSEAPTVGKGWKHLSVDNRAQLHPDCRAGKAWERASTLCQYPFFQGSQTSWGKVSSVFLWRAPEPDPRLHLCPRLADSSSWSRRLLSSKPSHRSHLQMFDCNCQFSPVFYITFDRAISITHGISFLSWNMKTSLGTSN